MRLCQLARVRLFALDMRQCCMLEYFDEVHRYVWFQDPPSLESWCPADAVLSIANGRFLDLSSSDMFVSHWKQLPNIQLSRGIAFVNAGQEANGKQALYTAVSRHPWVVARLFQELNIDPPPSV